MQPEHRGYSRCSDFLCVPDYGGVGRQMKAPPRFQTPEASGGYQDQAIASSYLAKSL